MFCCSSTINNRNDKNADFAQRTQMAVLVSTVGFRKPVNVKGL